jgi:multidrug efflux system outer membrane protein
MKPGDAKAVNFICRLPWYLAISAALLLASCAVGPKYQRPPVNSPANFRGEPATKDTNSIADLPWWQIFHDETLQGLIRTALTNNYDLRIAVTRVEQSKEVVAEARSQFFPQIGYEGGVYRGRNTSTGVPSYSKGVTTTELVGAADASWQIDLFGRIRRMTESARAQYFATREARRDVTISVISQVAQNYFQLLALDRDLEIARQTTNSFADSLRIFNQRLNGGVGSKLETSAAEAALAAVAAVVPDLERQIVTQENVISILLGENPGSIVRKDTVLDEQFPKAVPAGLPSALLERRPDIRQAEQQLRSANAQVGVAEADFYPQISLTGLFGQVSPELSAFTGGTATAWSAAAALTGPIFEGGLLRAQYRQALAARNQFALQYQSTVLNALREVSDDIVARDKLAEARIQNIIAVKAYEDAVKIATERYRAGQSSYYEVLQEQQLLFPAQNSLVQTELNQLDSLVQLYQALGGGWQMEDHPPAPRASQPSPNAGH